MILHLNQLVVGYRDGGGQRTVAGPFDATLRSGTLTCLVGRNGVGKSTLLRTLSGVQAPLGGEICIDDEPLSMFGRHRLSTTIGVVLTARGDLAGLTVEDVVAMGRTPYTNFWGTLAAEDRAAVADALEAVGMTALAHKRMTQLSDGERQKTMTAKALAQQTPIIILDEPSAFLDYPSKIALLELLAQLAHERDRLVLLSTHDLEAALRIADHVWMMDGTSLEVNPSPASLAKALHYTPAPQASSSAPQAPSSAPQASSSASQAPSSASQAPSSAPRASASSPCGSLVVDDTIVNHPNR